MGLTPDGLHVKCFSCGVVADPPTEPPNFHEYIERCSQHFDDPDCRSYLESRGFGDDDFDTLRSFRIGFDAKERLLIIPHSDFYYTAQPIDPVDKAERFKHNPKGAKAEIFNAAALADNETVVVCEGVIDALSLIVCGIPAVGLPGVNNCHKQLIDAILADHPFADLVRLDPGLILASDNDINDAFKSDRSSLVSRIKAFKEKEEEENKHVVPIKAGIPVRPDAPPEFVSEADLPPLPDGSQWHFELAPEYQIDRHGIYRMVDSKKGGFEWKRISHSAIYIEKLIKNIDNGTHKLQLAAYNHGYGWTESPSIPAEYLGFSHKIIKLSNWDFDVTSNNARYIIKYLSSFEAVNAFNIPRIKTVNRPGWQKDGSFVYPNASGDLQLDDDLKDMLSPIFTTAGDRQPIVDLLKKHRDIPVLNLVVGAALAAPLVKILDCQNIAVHFYGNTGSGKSTASKLAWSLFGDPNANGALPTANATKAGLKNFFDSRHDLPAFVEAIESVTDKRSGRIIQELTYQFVNKTGGNDRLIDFRGSLITNGERPLTTAASSGDGKRRLLEYRAPDTIFDKYSARIINETIEENHGLFGHRWIQFIQTHDNNFFRSAFNKIRLGSDEFDGLSKLYPSKIPLHIDTISAITIANILFCRMLGDTGLETQQFYLRWACDMVESLPDEIEIKDSERAKDFIRDFILSHPKNFTYPIDARDDPTTHKLVTDTGKAFEVIEDEKK